MSLMLDQWNTEIIKQFNIKTGQALLSDEQTLAFFSQDFGKLVQSIPSAVCIPKNSSEIQSLVLFAAQHRLPLTIRGNGLSQAGQSLPIPGGLTLCMQEFNHALELTEDASSIWVEANCSWSQLLELSLQKNKAPFVLPYNCNLSVAGVLSAGGVGSSSFKYGAINAHIRALEVINSNGEKQIIDKNSLLFKACLSGQGRFAVITKACVELRPVQSHIKTVCLVYDSIEQWFTDMNFLSDKVDYMELFCSPSVQGARLKDDKRVPYAQWLYGLHYSVEYSQTQPDSILDNLNPYKLINIQEETISSYLLRHNSRFEAMKMLGQWDLFHPWYECFVATSVLKKYLHEILEELPLYYANLVHVVPMAKQRSSFLMLPDEDSICSLMILNPGIPAALKEGCLQAIQHLDRRLLALGSKRYLSGFLGESISQDYWTTHFGKEYAAWSDLKKQYDPVGIFQSILHPQ